MKTKINTLKKVLLISSLIFSIGIIKATNAPVSNTVSSETVKTIKDYFKFPRILMPYQEEHILQNNKVVVLFSTDKNGKVNFVLAKTEDKSLKTEIEKQFSNLHLTKLKHDVVHSVTLNFKSKSKSFNSAITPSSANKSSFFRFPPFLPLIVATGGGTCFTLNSIEPIGLVSPPYLAETVIEVFLPVASSLDG